MFDDASVHDHDCVEMSNAMDGEWVFLLVIVRDYPYELVHVVVHVFEAMPHKSIVLYVMMMKDVQHHDV